MIGGITSSIKGSLEKNSFLVDRTRPDPTGLGSSLGDLRSASYTTQYLTGLLRAASTWPILSTIIGILIFPSSCLTHRVAAHPSLLSAGIPAILRFSVATYLRLCNFEMRKTIIWSGRLTIILSEPSTIITILSEPSLLRTYQEKFRSRSLLHALGLMITNKSFIQLPSLSVLRTKYLPWRFYLLLG